MMLSLVTDKRESASFWKPGKEMCLKNESNMWAESSLSPPGSCKVPYFPFTLGCCVPYLLRQTSVSLRLCVCTWSKYELVGREKKKTINLFRARLFLVFQRRCRNINTQSADSALACS